MINGRIIALGMFSSAMSAAVFTWMMMENIAFNEKHFPKRHIKQ